MNDEVKPATDEEIAFHFESPGGAFCQSNCEDNPDCHVVQRLESYDEMRKRIRELEAALFTEEAERDALAAKLAAAEDRIEGLQENGKSLRLRVDQLNIDQAFDRSQLAETSAILEAVMKCAG